MIYIYIDSCKWNLKRKDPRKSGRAGMLFCLQLLVCQLGASSEPYSDSHWHMEEWKISIMEDSWLGFLAGEWSIHLATSYVRGLVIHSDLVQFGIIEIDIKTLINCDLCLPPPPTGNSKIIKLITYRELIIYFLCCIFLPQISC